jgi:hypothetical protein
MRLTLRTLLAWLDDTLQPTQVREIGKQVAESPLAQELTERIHRVTRQRRLTVPRSSGPDATDPNVVASYLDNDLDPETVAEYEKTCLNLDVNLAEVASVHQILSLLGQKVKVPAAARTRMYQLVRGREAMPSRPTEARRHQAPEPVTKPIQPWVVTESPRRPWIERFGPVAVCLSLIVASIWSAWRSLMGPAPYAAPVPFAPVNIAQGKATAPAGLQGEDRPGTAMPADSTPTASADNSATGPDEIVQQSQPTPTGGQDSNAKPSSSEEASVTKVAKDAELTSKSSETARARTIVPGAAGAADGSEGILVRYSNDEREWQRVIGQIPLARSDRLLCLSPARATVTLGNLPLMLVGETELRILPQSSDNVPAIELIQGRILMRNPASGSLKLRFSERDVTLEVSPADNLAIERSPRREYGQSVTAPPPLAIYCTRGEIAVSVDAKRESLSASDLLVVDTAGQVKRATEETLPPWTTEAEPSAHELQLRDQFARMFHPGQPVLREIVAATEDNSADIKRLSISALKSLGDLSFLMPLLSRRDDPIARRSTAAAIRAYMGLGPAAANRVRDQLVQEFGADTGSKVEKMLIGYSAEEASSPQLYERLVALLLSDQESVGVRELALDTLKFLTGRDDLGYDPDHPDEKSLNAWKELQRQGKLRLSVPHARTK